MKEWQFTVLFWVGVGGTLLLLLAPALPGFEGVPKNPAAVTGIGAIMTYLFTRKDSFVKKNKNDDTEDGEK